MPRYRFKTEYDGAPFRGWQVQPGEPTVQETLQRAIATVARQEQVHVMGSGRTDAGVHALAQVAAFDLEREIDPRKLELGVNALVAPSVCVYDLERTRDDFQPHFDALERRYLYTVLTRRSPLLAARAWFVPDPRLDPERMAAEAPLFLGERDFRPFCLPREDQPNTVCDMREVSVTVADGRIEVRLRANRFLHHQVRAMVGHLVEVGCGRMEPGSATRVLAGEIPGMRHWAPARGLALERVVYPDY